MQRRSVCRQQGRGLLASQMRLEARTEILQHVALLLPTGGDHRQHPLHEPAAIGTVLPPLILRQITAGRSARSEALFVGSTPSTRAKVHRPSSTLRISKHVAAVLAQPQLWPSSSAALTSRRNRAAIASNRPRSMVPSRRRCHQRNIRLDNRNIVRPVASPGPPRSIIAWKSRFKCDQQICRHAGSIHSNELWRSLVTTWFGLLPRIALATAAERVAAMVKTVVSAVTTTHHWALPRSSRHEVSSMLAAGASWTPSATSLNGASSTAADCRSSLETIPVAMDSPNRSPTICWTWRLLRR